MRDGVRAEAQRALVRMWLLAHSFNIFVAQALRDTSGQPRRPEIAPRALYPPPVPITSHLSGASR
jgi:hypothetical protein